MTAAEAQVLHNVYERQLDRLSADRPVLLADIVALAQAVGKLFLRPGPNRKGWSKRTIGGPGHAP